MINKDIEKQVLNFYDKNKTLTYKEIGKNFNLNSEQVRHIFRKNNLKKFKFTAKRSDLTEEQIEYFKQNYNDYPILYFVNKFNSSEKVIRSLLNEFSLIKTQINRYYKNDLQWSNKDIYYLKENYDKYSKKELAIYLNRPIKGVIKKLSELNLYTDDHLSNWSSLDIDFLKENHKLDIKVLSFFLERTIKSIEHKLNELNLKIKNNRLTNIELFVKNILDNLKINYKYNVQISNEKNFRPDFIIENKKLIIECNGDYWHGNPSIYSEEDLNQTQLLMVEKDQIKYKFYESLGYTVLIFWEFDINNNPKFIEQSIKFACLDSNI